MDFQTLIETAGRDIRDLKTACGRVSFGSFGSASFAAPTITSVANRAAYRINYTQEADAIEPVTILASIPASGIYLKPYDPDTQTQDLFVDYNTVVTGNLTLISTRQISSVTRIQ